MSTISIGPLKDIHPKHRLVVDAYLDNGMNATRAYMKIYPNIKYESAKVSAHDIFQLSTVQTYLEMRMRKLERRARIKTDDLVNDLLTIKEVCMEKIEGYNKNGKKIGKEIMVDAKNAISAINSLSNILGFNAPQKMINYNKDLPLTDDERRAIEAINNESTGEESESQEG